MSADEPVLVFASPSEWKKWLRANHSEAGPVWLRMAKKGAEKSITYAQALEVALCWGWIDSQKRGLDDNAFLQRFSRRKPTSPWSKINCAKVDALIAGGAMQPPGLVEVEKAKADGRWDRAYAGARTALVPEDLAAALGKNAKARRFFETLDKTNRYAILFRIQTAMKPKTRADRIARFVAMCARGETLHPAKKR